MDEIEELIQEAIRLQEAGDHGAAARACGTLLALEPTDARALHVLALSLRALGQDELALQAFSQSLEYRPDHVDTLTNLGNLLNHMDRLQEALRIHERAEALAPPNPRILANMGNTFLSLNRIEEALGLYKRAAAMEPCTPGYRYNAALAELSLGHFDKGWPLYEARLEEEEPWRQVKAHMWNGSPPTERGQSMLLLAEQGIGDTLQFVRYIPLLTEMGFHVSLLAHSSLKSLLTAQPWLQAVYQVGDQRPDFDHYCPLLSLPGLLHHTQPLPPHHTPYLTLPRSPTMTSFPSVAALRAPRIGLTWAGNPGHQKNHKRSIPGPLLARSLHGLPFSFVELQKYHSPADSVSFSQLPCFTRIAPLLNDFACTARIIENLDLVITVDTAVAHLSGALGKPVWILLPFAADWRWQQDRTDSPWYPEARLFRQSAPGDWDPPLAQLRAELLLRFPH